MDQIIGYSAFEEAVCKEAAAKGLGEYELYYQRDSADQVESFEGEIEKFSSSTSEGVCFRCIAGGKIGIASTELFTKEEAAALVARALQSAYATDLGDEAFLASGSAATAEPEAYAGANTALDIENALKLEKAALAKDCRVEMAQGEVGEYARVVRLSNAQGLRLSKGGSTAVAAVSIVAADESGEKYSDYAVKAAAGPDKLDIGAVAAKAVDKTLAQMGGRPIPSGSYKVLLDKSQVALLLAVFAPAFSAKNAQDGLSRLKGMEGRQVAAPAVTIVDDPAHPESCFPSPFDAEGVQTQVKNVVENGVLTTLLHNLRTAARAGVASTGNASKGSYASPVSVSPFTFYLKPGACTREELFAKAGDAVLITFMKGAHAGANAVTGDFSLESKGFLVEGGKITRPVQGITVAGNFFELLKNIEGVADDLEIDFSGVDSAFGGPTVLVSGLTIAGE